MHELDQKSKTVLAAQIRTYGSSILHTAESILKEMGAEQIKIDKDDLFFHVDGKMKHINIRTLMTNIFCLGDPGKPLMANSSMSNMDTVYAKSLLEIEKILRKISA